MVTAVISLMTPQDNKVDIRVETPDSRGAMIIGRVGITDSKA